MSVKELQVLTQEFADAFDQPDLQPILRRLVERPDSKLGM